MANRTGATPVNTVPTDRQYDEDFNQIQTTEEGPYITHIYYGPTVQIAAEKFERLFRIICTQSHQALILFHQTIQGIILSIYLYFRINSFKN